MAKRCGGTPAEVKADDPCNPPGVPAARGDPRCGDGGPLAWFDDMTAHCLEYAERAKAEGQHIVGIMCEYTPREIIMAGGGVPVCLCGGSSETIPPAEERLPANLCPLIKSTFGYHVTKENPFIEMADLVVAETTCDGKKKMFELMAESRPMHVLVLPHKQDDAEAFAHWLFEVRRLKAEIERRFDVEITAEKLREAIRVMNRERALRRKLAELMAADSPPLTGCQLLRLKSSISGIPEDLAQYERALEFYGTKAPDPADASRVRVLMTGVPMVHGQERVMEIVEAAGGAVVCLESCTGVKPVLEDVNESAPDPVVAIAEKYFHLPCSVMTPNERRMESLRRLARQYRAQCVVELIWQACLTYDVESALIKRLAEDELGLPYLRIETDYSPSDSARIAIRVEALLETVRGRQRAAAGKG